MTVVLPASLQGITVRCTGQMETRNGIAYAATVEREGVTLGTIENSGNGGGTWFYPASARARSWWKDACEDFAPQALIIQNAEFAEIGLPPIEGGGNTSEILADRVFDLSGA